MKRLIVKLVILLAVIFIILRISSFYLENKFLYKPDKELSITPDSENIPYEDVTIKTKDGQAINAWFVPMKDAKVTVLFCHGNGGNLSDRIYRIKFFHGAGFNFLMFDYRGYGRSTGVPSEQGFYCDAQAAYDYLASRKDVQKDKIVVYGVSLGGPVAAQLCLKRKVAALILENSLVSLMNQAQNMFPFLPMSIIITQKYDTLSKIKNIYIPKLIVQGMDDEVVSFEDIRSLYRQSAPPREFVAYEGKHDAEDFDVSDTYKNRIIKFLADYRIITSPGQN